MYVTYPDYSGTLQVGSLVPAEAAELHVVDAVHTRMGASDNLAMGSSTFLEVCPTPHLPYLPVTDLAAPEQCCMQVMSQSASIRAVPDAGQSCGQGFVTHAHQVA